MLHEAMERASSSRYLDVNQVHCLCLGEISLQVTRQLEWAPRDGLRYQKVPLNCLPRRLGPVNRRPLGAVKNQELVLMDKMVSQLWKVPE